MKLVPLNPVSPASVLLLSSLNAHQLVIFPGDHSLIQNKNEIKNSKLHVNMVSDNSAATEKVWIYIKRLLFSCVVVIKSACNLATTISHFSVYLAWPVVHSFSHLFELFSSFERTLVVSERSERLDCETVSVLLNHFLRLQPGGNLACCKISACMSKWEESVKTRSQSSGWLYPAVPRPSCSPDA